MTATRSRSVLLRTWVNRCFEMRMPRGRRDGRLDETRTGHTDAQRSGRGFPPAGGCLTSALALILQSWRGNLTARVDRFWHGQPDPRVRGLPEWAMLGKTPARRCAIWQDKAAAPVVGGRAVANPTSRAKPVGRSRLSNGLRQTPRPEPSCAAAASWTAAGRVQSPRTRSQRSEISAVPVICAVREVGARHLFCS
jgi:hypothetical protein